MLRLKNIQWFQMISKEVSRRKMKIIEQHLKVGAILFWISMLGFLVLPREYRLVGLCIATSSAVMMLFFVLHIQIFYHPVWRLERKLKKQFTSQADLEYFDYEMMHKKIAVIESEAKRPYYMHRMLFKKYFYGTFLQREIFTTTYLVNLIPIYGVLNVVKWADIKEVEIRETGTKPSIITKSTYEFLCYKKYAKVPFTTLYIQHKIEVLEKLSELQPEIVIRDEGDCWLKPFK